MKKNDDNYSADETKARVRAAVQGAFSASSKLLKSMRSKGTRLQSKKRRKRAKTAS